MTERDKQFFNKHWEEWVKRNPAPDYWQGTDKEWAIEEMPYCGFLGKFIFWLMYFG